MTAYRVEVPFESLLYEDDPSTSRTTELPSGFDLPAMNVVSEAGGTYRAELHVEAANGTSAKDVAVDRVEEFLALQAARNDGFRVRLRGVRATPLSEGSNVSVERIEEERTICVTVSEPVQVDSSLDMVVQRSNVGFAEAALNKRERWPEKLSTVLKLNYLAVASHDAEPALVVQSSALEVLTSAILGGTGTVLKTEVTSKADRKNVLKDMKGVLEARGLSPEGAKRVTDYAETAKVESNIDRIVRALSKCGVEATGEEVRFVLEQRGKTAHAAPPDKEDLNKAYELARSWTQTAVRYIVETQDCSFPQKIS